MMLAVEALSAGWTAFLAGLAFVLFVVAAVVCYVQRSVVIALVSAGLAAVTFITFWNALAAT